MFYILFYVYSSDHPEIKLGVATRWDAGQRVGDGLQRKEKRKGKNREERCGWLGSGGDLREGSSEKRKEREQEERWRGKGSKTRKKKKGLQV